MRQQGAEWLERARHVEYLNELALGRDELDGFLDDLREWRNLLGDTAESRFALAVAAVNWACYQEEDEGFRDSFTRRILGFFDDRSWAERLGSPIEAAITEWSGLPAREGAYRYVGLIREQAGLSYFHLERFASLLNSLKHDPGWGAIQTASPSSLQEAVRHHFGDTCSGSYLCSPSGLAFIRAVCRDLVSYYSRRLLTLDDLDSARGYRPGVMRLVIEALERLDGAQPPTQPGPKGHAWAEPRLVLDEEGRLCLQFDPGEVSRRLIRCDQYAHSLFDAKLPVGVTLPPREIYSGTRTTPAGEESWSVRGWRPSGKDWALFDSARQFVCSSRDVLRIPPDVYYIVIDTSVPIDKHMVTADFGYLDLDGFCLDTLYAVYAVELTLGRSLPGLAIQSVTSVARPKLEIFPDDVERWGRYAGIDAIWSTGAPRLRLTNWTEENSRRFVLVRRIGDDDPVRLPVQPTPDGTAVIDLSDIPTPSIGRVWLEPKGRTSSIGAIPSQITFARWPRCQAVPPQGLWALDATPEFRLLLDSSVRCDVEKSAATQVSSEATFRVNPRVSSVPVRLLCGQINLDLRLPLHRARLVTADEPESALYLEPASLVLPPASASTMAAPFLLTAVPGSLVDVVLADCLATRHGVVVAHKRIGASGSCGLQPNEVVDAIRASGIAIGRFEVHDGGSMAATEAWYVDLDHLPADELDATAIARLPRPLRDTFGCINAVKEGNGMALPGMEGIMPQSAKRFVSKWLWAARLLDGWSVPARAVDFLSSEQRRILDGISTLLSRESSLDKAVDAVAQAQQVIAAWDQRDPQGQLRSIGLDLARWARTLRDKREKLQWIADVEQRTSAAIASVKTNTPDADVPPLLRNAWRQYLLAEQFDGKAARDYVDDAAQHIHTARDEIPPPWCDIGRLLLPLCYLRLCLIRSFLVQVRTIQAPRYANLAWCQLSLIGQNLAGAPREIPAATDAVGIAAISPRRDDQALAHALMGGTSEWIGAAQTCWIGAWLGWRWAHLTGRPADEKARLYDALLNQSISIPASLEREDLMAEIERQRPGVWQ